MPPRYRYRIGYTEIRLCRPAGEVVQRTKGLRLHSANRRRQGRVCQYLGRRERRTKLAQGQSVEYEIESNRGKESAVSSS